jgi:hypothetical protein
MIFKLDNVTNLTAARWAAAEGFDSISFNFDKADANYIKPMLVAEICKWVTGIKFIGNFVNAELSVIQDLSNLLTLDAIETDLETAKKLALEDTSLVLQLNTENFEEGLEFAKNNPNILAFSFQNNKIPEHDFPIEKSFIPSKIRNETLKNKPWGISFDSANETEPGMVDFENLELALNYWKNL